MPNEIDLRRLREPFPADDIQWRIAQSGMSGGKPWAKVLAYVTNRAIMDRLDEVVGPENWENEFSAGPQGGVVCTIRIRIDGRIVSKSDGAENTDIESVKGGLSDSMKRAAVHWGIGRYLYDLDEGWATFGPNGRYKSPIKSGEGGRGEWFSWDPPALPEWAIPSVQRQAAPEAKSLWEIEYRGPMLEMLGTDKGKKAFPGGPADVKAFVESKQIAGFREWKRVLICTDPSRLDELVNAIVDEMNRRAGG